MESFVRDLKKEVQCSLCNDTLTEPKIVSCFHTFCKPCIKRHAELIDEVDVFKCPRCKSQTPLPELNSVEDLQPSLLHSRILKGLALVEGEKVCSVSESHSSASWYCFDCDRSMCDECEKSHSFFTKDHEVVRLGDLKKEDIEFIISRENPCTSHPQHRLEFFCEDCDEMICVPCWIQDHKGHKTISLAEFASIKKAELSNHLDTLEHLTFDEEEKQQQEKIANTIKQQGEKVIQDVKDQTNMIIEMLRENERELLRQIDEKLDTATANVNMIHHISAAKKYINKVINKGLSSEMMNNTKEKKKFIFSPFPPYSKMDFAPNSDLLRQANSGLGEIQIRLMADPTKSTIRMSSQTEALKREKLTLITNPFTGDVSHDSRDVIDIQITPERDVKIEKKSSETDGVVEVEFMAKVAGQLRAEVQVNGNHVSNSPLVVIVTPQVMRITERFYMKGVNIIYRNLNCITVNRDNSRIAVADLSSQCVHVFTAHGQLSMTYGSGHGQVFHPQGVAFLNNTDLVIADGGNHRICVVNTTTGALVKTFGNQGNGDGEFCNPQGVHIDDDVNIIVCDRGNRRVQVFTGDGAYQYQFGLTTQEKFDPLDVITHDGLFYVSDCNNHVIHVFEKKGNVPTRISTIGGSGRADGQLTGPLGLAIDTDNHLLVCDHGNNRLQKFTLDGRLVGKTFAITCPKYITNSKDGQMLVCTGDGVWYLSRSRIDW